MLSSRTNNATPFQIPSFFVHNQDLITTHDHFLFPNGNVADSPLLGNITNDHILNHDHKDNMALCRDHLNCDPFLVNLLPPRWKKPDAHINKHGHRKIVTAQGTRDRRVRLSIQVARQFFDLQDTLGFDKASKTLEWLLTKSKSAIEEIGKIKQSHCTTSASEQEKVIEAAEIGDNCKRNPSVSSSTSSAAKESGISMQKENSNYFLAKESRAKARERARERTKAKMSIRKLNELKKLCSDNGPIFPNSWNHLSSHTMLPGFNRCHSIEESILIEKRWMPLQNFTTYQQNLTSSKQVPLYSPSNTENWEISNNYSQEIASSTADLEHMAAGYIYGRYNTT